MDNPIPNEVRSFFWLRYFSSTKNFMILYDNEGAPLWSAYRHVHEFSDTLEALMNGKAGDFFELPLNGGLDSVFDHLKTLGSKNFLSTFDDKAAADPALPPFPVFKSRNVVEPGNLAPFMSLAIPLMALRLVRIGNDRFIGIIHITEAYNDIRRAEFSGPCVYLDETGCLLASNALFGRMLGERDADRLLHSPVGELLEFSHSPFTYPEMEDSIRTESIEDWAVESREWPFEDQFAEGSGRFDPDGLLVANPEPEESRFLLWRTPLPLDGHHFRLSMEYASSPAVLPGLILRGMNPRRSFSADIIGYNLNIGPQNRVILKKSGWPMRFFTLPEISAGASHVLEIEKKWDVLSFSLDGVRFGVWKEAAPFLTPSENRIYLVLRAGTSFKLRRMRFACSSWGNTARPGADHALRAWPKPGHGKAGTVYHVSSHTGILDNRNYTMLTFEDLSGMHERIRSLTEERDRLAALVDPEQTLIGESAALRNLRDQIARVAATDLTVLFEGETGTGKGMAAQLLHRLSPRRDAPFIKIDCSSIPSELVESELFGHEKGAFTGAVNRRPGKFEQAEGGTVFLDEVENLPAAAQAKLLAVLEDRALTRLGGTRQVRLNVRVIAASNRLLRDMIAEGRFRPDLFHRLNQVRLELPPLRDRREDIPLLAARFIDEANRIYHKAIRGLSDEAMRRLYNELWPGNVRELRNTLFRGHLFCKGAEIEIHDLDDGSGETPGKPASGGSKRRWGGNGKGCTLTEEEIRTAMGESKGVASQAARKLGISRITLYKLIKQLGVTADQFRA